MTSSTSLVQQSPTAIAAANLKTVPPSSDPDLLQLQISQIVLQLQTELLNHMLVLTRTTSGRFLVQTILKQVLNKTVELTGAEDSSLFLLNADGVICESILARGALIRDMKNTLIGKVLDRGLAGWVVEHRQVGVVADTLTDDRWLQLPDQPYDVRSAIAIPLLRGRTLLGLITLMHPQPNYFRLEDSQLLMACAEHLAVVIETAMAMG